jgi:hypothetical protein
LNDELSRPGEDIRAESKNDGADKSNPQSKLVKDILSRQAEQEAAGRPASKTQVRLEIRIAVCIAR